MQSALRLAARRAAACASSHRGVATTTTTTKAAAAAAAADAEAERGWVTALVQREVRAQMRAAKEEEEALALLRAHARQAAYAEWKRSFKMGYFLGLGYVATLYAVYKW